MGSIMTRNVPLSQVRRNGMPANDAGVKTYRGMIRRGEKFPPLSVIQEGPNRYRVFDGFHRHRAMVLEKITHAEVFVIAGS